MKLSTEKILAMLPFDAAFKTQLKEQLPSMDDDMRISIERTLWNSFATYYELKLQENIQLAVQAGDVQSDGTLYKRMEEKTMKDLETTKHDSVDKEGLDDVRKKLEQLIGSDST